MNVPCRYMRSNCGEWTRGLCISSPLQAFLIFFSERVLLNCLVTRGWVSICYIPASAPCNVKMMDVYHHARLIQQISFHMFPKMHTQRSILHIVVAAKDGKQLNCLLIVYIEGTDSIVCIHNKKCHAVIKQKLRNLYLVWCGKFKTVTSFYNVNQNVKPMPSPLSFGGNSWVL